MASHTEAKVVRLVVVTAPCAIGKTPQDVQGIAKKVERLHAIEYIGTCIVKQIGADAVDQFVGRFN
jgi:hypothetical protein